MAIRFLPDQMIKKIAPEKKIKKLISKNATMKRTALSFLDDADFIDKKKVSKVAIKTIRGYQERIAKAQVDAGFDASAGDVLESEIVADPRQLIQRVQNEIVFQVHQGIQQTYKGQRAVWLPSDAEEPRPEHQLNYGKEYIIGEGINGLQPGDEYGCKCGIEIITDETQLSLE